MQTHKTDGIADVVQGKIREHIDGETARRERQAEFENAIGELTMKRCQLCHEINVGNHIETIRDVERIDEQIARLDAALKLSREQNEPNVLH